jgi:hypothetical protein
MCHSQALGLLGSGHHSPTLQLSTQTRKPNIFKQSLLNARKAFFAYRTTQEKRLLHVQKLWKAAKRPLSIIQAGSLSVVSLAFCLTTC